MKTNNRLSYFHADFIFMIVKVPKDWVPAQLDDIPPIYEVLTSDYVASYEEAREDCQRCNRLAIEQGFNQWAIIQSTCGDL